MSTADPTAAPVRTLVPRQDDAAPAPAEASQQLLRRRLMGIAFICSLTCLQVYHVIVWDRIGPNGSGTIGQIGNLLLGVNVALCVATIAGLMLWRKPPELLLRVVRGTLLFLVGTLFAAWHYTLLTESPPAGFFSAEAQHSYLLFAQLHSLLTWVILIIVVGFFVVEEPTRTRWEMGLVWIAVLTVVGLALVTHPELRPDAAGLIVTAFGFPGTAIVLAELAGREARDWRSEAKHAREKVVDLQRYRLTRKLGEGGAAEIWLAEHRFLRRPCAVKLMRPGGYRDPSFAARMKQEVRATAQLAHPNIIEVYDCGMTDDGSSYYVMEYLPGLDLEHLVARAGPLPPGRTVALLRQVCAALRSAHRVGLVHRDVKPSNVMICGSPGRCDLAKLLDFGLVRPVRGGAMNPLNLTIPGHVIGTPDYMSPEQAVGVTDIDIRADLYALGGLAYFMLTGRPPFVRDTPLAALTAHAYEVPEPPSRLRSDVPFDLEVVVLRCLAKSPNDRFESAADVERALAKCRCANDWSTTDAEQWWEQQNEESPSASNNTLASALGR